jgi:hypothetical protein
VAAWAAVAGTRVTARAKAAAVAAVRADSLCLTLWVTYQTPDICVLVGGAALGRLPG